MYTDQKYDTYGGIQQLDSKILTQLKLNLQRNAFIISANKCNFRPGQLEALTNHHNFLISFLTDMETIQQVELSDIYSRQLIKNDKKDFSGVPKQEWEAQFDERLNLNPPCYLMPPQSITSIKRDKYGRIIS